jgi:hypothetical protein
MSFTAGGLFLREAPRVAVLYLELRDWNKVRDAVLDKNLLQLRTKSSGIRVSRELCARLNCLSETEIQVLADGNIHEKSALLWLAVCRQYRFVFEFSTEVLRIKFLTYQRELSYGDFDSFFNSKAAWHEELDGITGSTQAKLRQVLFRILHEAGLTDSQNVLQPVLLTPRFVKLISSRTPQDLAVFLVADADLKELLK